MLRGNRSAPFYSKYSAFFSRSLSLFYASLLDLVLIFHWSIIIPKSIQEIVTKHHIIFCLFYD